MELYLDTADVAAVKRLARILPLAGVTTNPAIVAGGKTPLSTLLPELQAALGGQGKIFAQVIAAGRKKWWRKRCSYARSFLMWW